MLTRICWLLLVSSWVNDTSWAVDNPFIGRWKVNPSKSKLTDEMKVEAVGENKYAFNFGPGAVDTIVADGTDQPAQQGTTLSVTVEGPKNWKVVRRKEGRPTIVANWTLSADGKTLDDDLTNYQPDGSSTKVHFTYQRSTPGSGFPGTWDSASAEVDSNIELEIQPYDGDGLSFSCPALQFDRKTKFDGRDHARTGPNVPPGTTSSGRRVSPRSVEITSKLHGKIIGTQHIEVSTDLKTLTMTISQAGEKEPKYLLVFERQEV